MSTASWPHRPRGEKDSRVNYEPPNPASEAFHTRLGFVEVGRATLPDRGKSVRYLKRDL
jgi:predicted GNAT superfamily acetyltransferase